MKKIQTWATATAQSLASLVKIPLMSRIPSGKGDARGRVIIMGNGPSLRDAIDNHRDALEAAPLVSVNFAPLTPEFFQLKPEIHILADNLFFAREKQGNIDRMWTELAKADWPMTLFIPAKFKNSPDLKKLPGNIRKKFFNLTPVQGYKWFSNLLYDYGLGMPRPRNVLIPAIMCAIREGYEEVILVGADHSWSKTLWVNDDNLVVTVQPHFYQDNEKERKRVEDLYRNIRLHQIYESFAVAFRSYFAVRDYANARGVRILNATPGSFIDAFPRRPL